MTESAAVAPIATVSTGVQIEADGQTVLGATLELVAKHLWRRSGVSSARLALGARAASPFAPLLCRGPGL